MPFDGTIDETPLMRETARWAMFPLHFIERDADGAPRCGCGGAKCRNVGKHPACAWSELAPAEKWRGEDGCGYGIATGKRSGVFVVDLDTAKHPDALADWHRLNGGACPLTYTVRTGSGGWHFYFRYPGFGVGNSASLLARGIDIRGDRGYVVAAGSPHKSGATYEAPIFAEVADAPAWLVDWLRARMPAESGPSAHVAARSLAGVPAVDVDAAAQLIADAWPARGARADARLALVGACCHSGLSEGDAAHFAALVHAYLDDRGDVTDAELATMARAAYLRHAAGGTVRGWTSLATYTDRDAADAARELLMPIDPMHAEILQSLAAAQPERSQVTAAPDAAAPMTSSAASTAPTAPTVETPKPKRMSVAERARRVGGAGLRIETGFPSLDRATRGGILARKAVVIGGAPGAGKTAMSVQLASRWLSRDVVTAFLAADEDADALLIRFGQLAGLSRERLEAGDHAEREKLARWADSVPFLLVDGDEDDTTIEQISGELRELACGRPSALIVDSIQTARTTEAPPKGADMRARINVVVRALKNAAKVDGHIVVATSELSKAAYRNRDQAENINPLSAFKESGDIEYGVGLALVLTSRIGSGDVVDAVVAKNRLGPEKPTMMLRLDHARAAVVETTPEAVKTLDPLYSIKTEVMAVVSAATEPMTKSVIYEFVGGRKAVVLRAIDELLDAKALHQDVRGGLRLPYPSGGAS